MCNGVVAARAGLASDGDLRFRRVCGGESGERVFLEHGERTHDDAAWLR